MIYSSWWVAQCTLRRVQKFASATCLKELFHITKRFFWENLSDACVDAPCVRHWLHTVLAAGHAMEWNGKWYGMEGKFWYEIWKMLRMEWKIWKKEWKIVFHTNFIYSIYQNLQQSTKDYGTRMRIISHFSVLQCKFLACSDWLYSSFKR